MAANTGERALWTLLVLAMAISTALAQGRPTRDEIWAVELGMTVAELPTGFIEHACGTFGGPPSTPLSGFAEFARCPVDVNGLREVYFRYDDELEYIFRAMEQAQFVHIYQGTQVFDYPANISLMFDPGGVVKGIRVVTDPRHTEIRDRISFWTMGQFFLHRFGADVWTCVDLPAADGETAIGERFVKERCDYRGGGLQLTLETQLLRKQGQLAYNPVNGRLEEQSFDSWAWFEMYTDDVELVATGNRWQAPQ